MKKLTGIIAIMLLFGINTNAQKSTTKTGHAHFLSETSIENIEANNYKVISTLDTETGVMVFSVPMQSFEFPIALMQKHYNSKKFLDTKKFPKATFKGTISDLKSVNFKKDGKYSVKVPGTMTLHGVSREIIGSGTITVKDGKISGYSKFELVLADYDVVFEKGKPSSNIAKTVTIDVTVKY
jgi:polyisoprenoid-binding protein YceI